MDRIQKALLAVAEAEEDGPEKRLRSHQEKGSDIEEESQKREAKRSIQEEAFDVENKKRLDKHKEKWEEGRTRRGDVKALENDIKMMTEALEIREQEYRVI